MHEQMNIVIAGHVDHGKSTIIGRLLADTGSLPEGKLEQIKALCEFNSKPFEYSFLLDTLKDERSQGITIDSARIFFKTEKRDYIIIDAPGHIEFLKNMISGASRAEAALLVIDASEGVKENSRRHGFMLSMLGIKQVSVAVNKMDLVNYSEETFDNIKNEFEIFLNEINIIPQIYIPLSGRNGDNIYLRSDKIPWFKGPSLIEVLDNFNKEKLLDDKPFRMPVQDIYKFTKGDDERRIIAGTVETGKIKTGDELVFFPSGKRSMIKTIEAFNKPLQTEVSAGYSAGFTLEEQIYIKRGELAVKSDELSPHISDSLKASIFWLGANPFIKGKKYFLKLGTSKIHVELKEIIKKIDAHNLDNIAGSESVNRHDVAECILHCTANFAFDTTDKISATSRFVIVDDYEIAGGGIILEAVNDKFSWVREKVASRNFKWERSNLAPKERAEKYNQKPMMILFTGNSDSPKKEIAKHLESKLFSNGRFVYFLGIGNLLYGVDADIKNSGNSRDEHLRRLAEVSHLMLDAGLILIITATDITGSDLDLLKTVVDPDRISTIWVGNNLSGDIKPDLILSDISDTKLSADKILSSLADQGIIFKA